MKERKGGEQGKMKGDKKSRNRRKERRKRNMKKNHSYREKSEEEGMWGRVRVRKSERENIGWRARITQASVSISLTFIIKH